MVMLLNLCEYYSMLSIREMSMMFLKSSYCQLFMNVVSSTSGICSDGVSSGANGAHTDPPPHISALLFHFFAFYYEELHHAL